MDAMRTSMISFINRMLKEWLRFYEFYWKHQKDESTV